MDPDDALLARLAQDLEAAFPALVEAHAGRLYTIAHRYLGVAGDAEEVAQDALVRAYTALGEYEATRIRGLRLKGWLATITMNLARNRRRRIADRRPPASLEPLVASGFEPPAPLMAGPAELAERRDARRQLEVALMRLAPSVREAIVLRHVDGLSVAETASTLGRPEGTVKAQVSRGLSELRRHLAAEFLDPSISSKELSA